MPPVRPALPSLEIEFEEVASAPSAASSPVVEADEVDELLEDDLIIEEVEEIDADELEPASAGSRSPLLTQEEHTTDRVLAQPGASSVPAAPPSRASEAVDRVQMSSALAASAAARSSSPELLVEDTSLEDLGLEGLADLPDDDELELDDGLELEEERPEDAAFDESEAPTNVTAPSSRPSSGQSAPPSAPAPESARSASTFDEAPLVGPPSEPPPPIAPPPSTQPSLSSVPAPSMRSAAGSAPPRSAPSPVVVSAAPSSAAPGSRAPTSSAFGSTAPGASSFPGSVPPQEPFPLAPSAQQPAVQPVAPPPPLTEPVVDGVSLADVSGLQDLPEDAQLELAQVAELRELAPGEEVSSFGVALVVAGSVEIMPSVADASCARAERGEVVFTRGSLEDGVALRVVGAAPGTRVAVWSDAHLSAATAACPWVADELALVADRYQALAGAVMGPLGESLDSMFRGMVLDKCGVRRFGEGDVLLERGKTVDGMYIVGVGWIELVDEEGKEVERLGPGDFLFPATILAASAATATARAGRGGALVLYATRMDAHELLATCPPFIELLAG